MGAKVALSTSRTHLSGAGSTGTPSGVRTVVIQNLDTSINVLLGDVTVTNSGGGNVFLQLAPGQIVFLDIASAGLLYAVAASGTPSIVVSVMG